MSTLGGFVGMIPGKFCLLVQFVMYFDAILPSKYFLKDLLTAQNNDIVAKCYC